MSGREGPFSAREAKVVVGTGSKLTRETILLSALGLRVVCGMRGFAPKIIMIPRLLVVIAMLGAVVLGTAGPFATMHSTFTYKALDITDHGIEAFFPVGANTTQGAVAGGTAAPSYPLISYAHGFGDGGNHVLEHYSGAEHPLLEELASWGYVVLAPRSCNDGCLAHCKLLPFDPPCFGTFYEEQLKAIDWARSSAGVAALPAMNASFGAVAVVGHSMGGQASLFSAAYNATTHGIATAVLHHAFTHTYPAVTSIPHLVFTGTADTTAPPAMAEAIFDAAGACATRGLVNKEGAKHDEPGGADDGAAYNAALPLFTAAWLKIHLDKTPLWQGHNFTEMIYGDGPTALCGGGDGDMAVCKLLRG